MPWRIEREHEDCPDSRPWAVVKIDDGELEGCHTSEEAAQRQLAALNAAEEEGRMREVRRLDLPLAEARAKVEDGRTLVGYAAVFNRPVEIDTLRSSFKETVKPGAFAKTLKKRGDQIRVLFNHGMDPSIGEKPLGRPALMEEDNYGLRVAVPLDQTSYNDDIIASVRSGALGGMSIQFAATQDKWSKDRSERSITEASLYEFGPVTFPAQPAAVAEVRCEHCNSTQKAGGRHESVTHDSRGRGVDFLSEAHLELLRYGRQLKEEVDQVGRL